MLQALLLLGGAFVFAVLIWGVRRHDFYVDRTPSAPESAVFAATIDRTSPEWAAFEAKLPEGPRQAFVHAGDLKSVTIFAVPGPTKDLQWGMVEALSAVTERTGRKSLRIVPKGTDAVGFIGLGGRKVQFEAKVGQNTFQAEVGRTYRGLAYAPNPFAEGRRILLPMHQQNAFVEKPSGVSWNPAADLLGGVLQHFQPQAGLWRLPGHMELAASASRTPGLNPFILYYRPEHGHDLAGPTLETYAKALLAESDPVGFKVMLPDDTQMIELRREPDAVLTTRKSVKQFGERAQMMAPGGSQKMEIFYANDGEAWLSNDLNLIQAAIFGAINAPIPSSACERGGAHGFAAFSSDILRTWPYFETLSRLTFSIHNSETGMFTTCGYLAP